MKKLLNMKFILLVIIGALLWNNNDARHFTADLLDDTARIVRPDYKQFTGVNY
tara:strand:+ start:269 stop:427 length:159 start_codon:yes stop_codon:yes gene_type:complete